MSDEPEKPEDAAAPAAPAVERVTVPEGVEVADGEALLRIGDYGVSLDEVRLIGS